MRNHCIRILSLMINIQEKYQSRIYFHSKLVRKELEYINFNINSLAQIYMFLENLSKINLVKSNVRKLN